MKINFVLLIVNFSNVNICLFGLNFFKFNIGFVLNCKDDDFNRFYEYMRFIIGILNMDRSEFGGVGEFLFVIYLFG